MHSLWEEKVLSTKLFHEEDTVRSRTVTRSREPCWHTTDLGIEAGSVKVGVTFFHAWLKSVVWAALLVRGEGTLRYA